MIMIMKLNIIGYFHNICSAPPGRLRPLPCPIPSHRFLPRPAWPVKIPSPYIPASNNRLFVTFHFKAGTMNISH